jgi:signal transduction histidine kinase
MLSMLDRLRCALSPNSLRSRLLLLVVTAFVPLLAFAVAMVILSAQGERAVFERGATERTRALLTAVDAELRSSIATLQALATSRQLEDDHLRAFYDESARVLKSQPGWRTIIVSAPSGESILNLQRPLGVPLEPVVEKRSFNQLMKTLKPVAGDVLFGPVVNEYGYIIRVPVMREGKLKYVLSAVISVRTMDALLSPQKMPPNWIAVVLDGERRFVSRTVEPARSVGRLASDSLRAALDRSSEGWFRGSTVEGWDVYTPYNRSDFSGWTVAMGIPADVVDRVLRRSLTYLVLLGGGLLALSLLIAWILSNRTAASIGSLATMVQGVVSGIQASVADVPPTRITEVEAVREAFVTANRLLREQSEEKERITLRLRLAMSSGNIGVYEWLPQSDELIWDDRVRAHWGLSPGTPITYEVFLRGLHPADRAKVKTELKRALEPTSDRQYSVEFRVIGIEDHVERWIEARGQVMFVDAKPVRLTGTTIDITERKAFQAELERQVAERTARLQETVGELEAFSYSISHDMRAPLRAMEGYADALMNDYHHRLDSEGRRWLDRISRSAHRLDSLIKDVLAYSRVSQGEIELAPVNLEKVIEDILSTNPEFQAPHSNIVLQTPLHQVIAHEACLTQCVTNLLGNAVKFVAEGIVPEIRIRTERLDGKVRIWFEDNGIGIDDSHLGRIFEIFGQVYPEERYSGTGIGLAIVKKAVQRMHGEVGVESQLYKGSRFWLILDGVKNDS